MRPIESELKIGLEPLRFIINQSSGKVLRIALDIESTGLTVYEDHITWVSWCTENQYGAIPIRHRNLGTRSNAAELLVREALLEIHRNSKNVVIWHNASFDLSMLVASGWLSTDDVRATIFDTMLASYVLNPVKTREGGRHSLKKLYDELLRDAFDPKQPDFESTCNGMDFEDVKIDQAAFYAAFDAFTTFHIEEKLGQQLQQDKPLLHYYKKIEIPHLLSTVELITSGLGILPQSELFKESLTCLSDLKKEFDSVQQQVFKLVGRSFNFASPDSMRAALFNSEMSIRPRGKGQSGRHLLDKDTLSRILCEEDDPIARKVIGLVLYGKQLSTTIMKHAEMYDSVNRVTKRIHPNIRPTTSSGRYAGSKPNTLSLSTTSRIKEHIVPTPGKIFVIGDFSQIDLRVIANETGEMRADSKMLIDVNSGIDLHLNTLKIVDKRANKPTWKKLWKDKNGLRGIINFKDKKTLIKGKALDELKSIKDARHQIAKPINFGVSYGLGPSKLLLNLNTDDEFREAMIDTIPAQGSGMTSWKKWLKAVEKSIKKPEHTIDGVKVYLTKFHLEYPDIRLFQDKLSLDLEAGGVTYNLFGKRCVAEIFPHLDQCTLDLKTGDGEWFRVRVEKVGMDKARMHCRLRQVNRLKVTEPRKRGKINLCDMKFEEGYEIYKIDEKRFQEIVKSYGRHRNLNRLKNELFKIHDESAWDCGDFFQRISQGPLPPDLTGEDCFNAPLNSPYIFIPHILLKKVRVDGTTLDLTYLGYDKLRRNLISARVSSTSMDFCKIAMTEFRNRSRFRWPDPKLRPRIVNCIHDEIAVECLTAQRKEVERMLKECMEDSKVFRKLIAPGRRLLVSIEAEVSSGPNYKEAKP